MNEAHYGCRKKSCHWTQFLPLSSQAYQISCITNISPVNSCETYKISRIRKYVRKEKCTNPPPFFFFYLSLFLRVKTAQFEFDGCKILISWFFTSSNSQKLTALSSYFLSAVSDGGVQVDNCADVIIGSFQFG